MEIFSVSRQKNEIAIIKKVKEDKVGTMIFVYLRSGMEKGSVKLEITPLDSFKDLFIATWRN